MKKQRLFIVIFLVLILSGFGIFALNRDSGLAGYTKVESYNGGNGSGPYCLAYEPQCGLCLGEVIDGECWVNLDQLTEEEKGYMGF